ncbi:MAG: DUF1275 domain-containing protein, partial [Verrucomicrobia bacterium]|nr:DUF1275 domain-containing protein [Verrucomicrobiota bacterium]
IAGSVDIIGFLGLNGLFIAHITGNLVVLAARIVAGDPAPVSYIISVPVFVAALLLTRLLVACLDRVQVASLVPLLLVQFLLLSGFLSIGVIAGHRENPHAAIMIFAGMLGVAAMAVQNALVKISLPEAPSTAVATTNTVVLTMDIGTILLSRDPKGIASARGRAGNTWPAVAGFLAGCIIGGAGESLIGLRSLAFPVSLSLLALFMGIACNRRRLPGELKKHSDDACV